MSDNAKTPQQSTPDQPTPRSSAKGDGGPKSHEVGQPTAPAGERSSNGPAPNPPAQDGLAQNRPAENSPAPNSPASNGPLPNGPAQAASSVHPPGAPRIEGDRVDGPPPPPSNTRPTSGFQADEWARNLRTQTMQRPTQPATAAVPPREPRPPVGAEPEGPSRRPRAARKIAIAVGGTLALLGGAYGVAYLAAGNGVPQGTTVLGVQIGGLSPIEAEQRLADQLPPRVDSLITVTTGAERSYEVQPSQAGLTIDYVATVAAAGGGGADPVSVFQRLFGGGPVEPVTAVDRAALTAAMEGIAENSNAEPVEGAISFEDGEPVVTKPVPGVALKVPEAADALAAAFPNSTGPIELPVEAVPPAIDQAEVDRTMQEFAEPAMSGLVTLSAEGKTATIGPKQLSKALTLVPEGGKLAPRLDGAKLQQVAEEDLARLGSQGRDATIRIENGRPQVVPHETGRGVTADALAEAVLPALTETGSERTAKLTLETVEPKLTTEQANKLGVKEVVGTFRTQFPHASYRNTNIGRAAELIDNTLLLPGETFSLNDLVGERTVANGFAKGTVIKDGRLQEDLGGGVSQLATTTFNAAWEAGLEDVEHHPHGLYFPRYPAGREATVWWGAKDLRFQNNTPYGVVVETVFRPSSAGSQGSIRVNIWSTKYWSVDSKTGEPYNYTSYRTIYQSGPDCEPQSGIRGFDVRVTRTRTHGSTTKVDKLFHRYNTADQIICRAESDSDG